MPAGFIFAPPDDYCRVLALLQGGRPFIFCSLRITFSRLRRIIAMVCLSSNPPIFCAIPYSLAAIRRVPNQSSPLVSRLPFLFAKKCDRMKKYFRLLARYSSKYSGGGCRAFSANAICSGQIGTGAYWKGRETVNQRILAR